MAGIVLSYNEMMDAVGRLLVDLQAIFAGRLLSLVVYGRHAGATPPPPGLPIHTMALVDSVGYSDLEACGRAARGWHQSGLAVPLVIGRHEFQRSLDVFPVEFGAIIDAHRVVFGDNPLAGLSVADEDLRRACEIDVKGHLLHLREAYIERHGDVDAVAKLVRRSAAALRTLTANVARLDGQPSATLDAVLAHMTTALGPAHGRALAAVLAIGESPIPATDSARLFPDYLAAAEALAGYVDAWR